MSALLSDELRTAFLAIADVLIPRSGSMPAASEADVGGAALDRILSIRDDLRPAFFRGLQSVCGLPQAPDVAARELNRDDPKALATIGLIASAAYYMNPRVRELIGYPGQERRPIDPDAEPDYMQDNLLQPVIDRGPIYRPTPK